MNIIPSIDLRQGNCVRLYKGDFSKQTSYDIAPVTIAKSYQQAGAKFLHIVDLDGAKNGKLAQLNLISEIAKNVSMTIQTGGGIRTENDIQSLLDAGVSKVVLGSIAVKNIELVKSFFQRFGADKIVLALDVNMVQNDPMVCTAGWQNQSEYSIWKLLENYPQCQEVLCTDIQFDGTLEHPSFELYEKFKMKAPRISLQASGGVSCLDDIKKLRETGADGCIIGRALYEKRFTISEALQC